MTMTIQQKLNATLAVILLAVLVIAVGVSARSEQQLSETMVHDLLKDKASGYLDSMNMLMVSGAIGNRELLRQKLLSDDTITEARMLRSPKIDAMYGKGLPHEYAADELDRRALAGETIAIAHQSENGRTITWLEPVIASANYRGTNCLGCHQAKEGDILGATRITYSMNTIDAQIRDNMIELASIQGGMVIIALVALSLLLRSLIVSPTRAMQRTLHSMEQDSDLTLSLPENSQDEIGQTGRSLNRMVQRLAHSLREVIGSATLVEQGASRISHSAASAKQAADIQRSETADILNRIEELMHSTSMVTDNARQSTESAKNACQVADEGMGKTSLAVDKISSMNGAIADASSVIGSLDEKSNNVGNVLGVIKEIAEQTNLLALNAAIEAARAGESGRGFAVVADEVRTLSQRTHDSAREIETMIAQLQTEAQNAVGSMTKAQHTATDGVMSIRDAADALANTIEQMNQVTHLSQQTLSSMEHQLHTAKQVESGIHKISNESSATANSANDTNQIASELLSLSAQLGTMVRHFRV